MLKPEFFASIRQSSIYAGKLTQAAVDGMNAVSVAFDGFARADKCADDLAIIMATVVIETGPSFNLGIEEIGKGAGRAYGKPAGKYGKVYYGRGPCQVTWLANYEKAKLRTGIDFVQFPERMCIPQYGVPFMIDAMFAGTFRRYKLRNYVTPGKVTSRDQFYNSRDIINAGHDRASEHAKYCVAFQNALKVGYVDAAVYVAERQTHEANMGTLTPVAPVVPAVSLPAPAIPAVSAAPSPLARLWKGFWK